MKSGRSFASGLITLLILAALPACNQRNSDPGAAAKAPPAEEHVTNRQTVADPLSPPESNATTDPRHLPGDGWKDKAQASAGGSASEPPARNEPVPLTQKEQVRYNRVARRLVEAINKQDKPAYRGLHTDEGWAGAIDWWQDMFSRQILRFGRIERAYPPRRGVFRVGNMGMGGDERNGATFLVIFEDQVGGLLSFELNSEDKITHTSVFIKEELAAHPDLGQEPLYKIAE